VKAVKAGRIDFKLDKNGNISAPIGKLSFDESMLVDNGKAVIDSVSAARPATAKGIFIQKGTLTATMVPGLKVDVSAWH
jgi:large subunit ribosomal protein L1